MPIVNTVALHAPTSGRIVAIRQQVQALPGAPLANSLILEADGLDTALPLHPASPAPLTRLDLALQLQEMGSPAARSTAATGMGHATASATLADHQCRRRRTRTGCHQRTAERTSRRMVAAIAMLEQVLQPARTSLPSSNNSMLPSKPCTAVAGRNWQIATITAPYPAADEATLRTLLAQPEEARLSLCLPVDAVPPPVPPFCKDSPASAALSA
jgi:electron transport complex protein RnfC